MKINSYIHMKHIYEKGACFFFFFVIIVNRDDFWTNFYYNIDLLERCEHFLDLLVVASRVVNGRKKDGSSFHFCRVWVELDDGSLYEMPARRDYSKGDVITCDLGTYGSSLRLNERG